MAESETLDYRREMYGQNDADRRESLRDVSSLANRLGGHLLIGIREEGEMPVEVEGIENGEIAAQRIMSSCLSGFSGAKKKGEREYMEPVKKPTLKALVVYYSAGGNTEKVAHAIHETLLEEKVKSTLLKVHDASGEELYNYDLVFLGSPSYEFLPAAPVMQFIKKKMNLYRKRGDIKLCAPRKAGKTAIVFCTYSGPHTGINEAITAGKYMAQFFEHIGFGAAHELYVVGEFRGWQEANTMGRLGDIRGRPNAEDLSRVRSEVSELVKTARAEPVASS